MPAKALLVLRTIPQQLTWKNKQKYMLIIENTYKANEPVFSDIPVWANSADTDQTAPKSDQDLHYLLFVLLLLEALFHGRTYMFDF